MPLAHPGAFPPIVKYLRDWYLSRAEKECIVRLTIRARARVNVCMS